MLEYILQMKRELIVQVALFTLIQIKKNKNLIYKMIYDLCVLIHPSNDKTLILQGCREGFTKILEEQLNIIGAVGLGICVVQVFGMVLSCCLYLKLRHFIDYDWKTLTCLNYVYNLFLYDDGIIFWRVLFLMRKRVKKWQDWAKYEILNCCFVNFINVEWILQC